MRERNTTRFSGRTLRRPTARKSSHESNDAPTEFHENGAPEFPFLPDEFNRNAPIPDAAEAEAKRKKHLRKLMMFLAATGAIVLGLFVLSPAPTESAEPSQANATYPANGSPVASPFEAEGKTAVPTAAPTATPTAAPTATPTATPTPEPEIDGIELLYAEWTEGTGESAVFSIYARVPRKVVEEMRLLPTELEVFAWINGMRTVDDWDGINTLEVSAAEYGQDSTFGEDENGDIIVTYTGTLYWADHPTPGENDLVTIAVCGVVQDTWELTDPSDGLTVGLGGKAFKYNTDDTA